MTTTTTRTDLYDAIINYFEENEEEFNQVIEELDSYNGFLGDDRYYEMDLLDEFYQDTEPTELLQRVFYGHDEDTTWTDERGEKHYTEFNPNREYFTYNGYGNLVSSDYKDYSAHLDKWFAESVFVNADYLDLPEEIEELINNAND